MNAIETHALTRRFGEHTAVHSLELAVPAGTVFGFLGPNGAGKTTTVRMLCALIAPTAGAARVAGHTLGAENNQIRRKVGILTETPGLYDKLSARQNLTFFARLYGLATTKAHTETERYLHLLGLWERRDDPVGGFSKGMRQKLAIARALLHNPEIIFLDEPTSGLDPEAARVVRDFIKELRNEGRTIFLTTHNLPEADELCDRIGVFRERLLRVDTPSAMRTGLAGHGTLVKVEGSPLLWRDVIAGLSFVHSVELHTNGLAVYLDNPEASNPALIQALVGAGARVQYIEPLVRSLEDVYLELVQHAGSSTPAAGR